MSASDDESFSTTAAESTSQTDTIQHTNNSNTNNNNKLVWNNLKYWNKTEHNNILVSEVLYAWRWNNSNANKQESILQITESILSRIFSVN